VTTIDDPGPSRVAAREAGVLVLRAWVEDGWPRRVRVRVTRVVGGRQPSASAASNADDVCAIVRAWLEELLGGRPTRVPRSPR
jgi:hypothetical protein